MARRRRISVLWGLGLVVALSGWSIAAEKDDRETLAKLNAHIENHPNHADAYLYRGLIWQERGELERAKDDFDAVIRFDPKNADALAHRAIVWQELGKPSEAEADFSKAIRLDPADPTNYFLRGILRRRRGDLKLAVGDWNESLRLEPRNAEALMQRALALGMLDQFEAALQDCTAALRIDPKLYPVWQLQGWIRATCPDRRFRDGPRALESARKACELSEWRDSLTIETLAAAFAESGEFKTAVRWQTKAIGMLPSGSGPLEDARTRLKLYESQKPFRDVTK
jgi:tetratricopeptide (TPR) repeat protein